jgi:DNA-binding winged helix-turn-helix (wHTH) protein/tetratricopeptide (TPR) repeat protein
VIRRVLRFGDCRLDIATRELWRAGVRVDLPPTVFDCIAYLIERRERAVGRDELVAAVWGKAAISDTMLGKAILAARRAVGDTAEAQAYLRTVPRFGYHWVGAVHEDAAVAAPAEPPPAPTPPPPQADAPNTPGRRRFLAAAAALLLVALIAAAAVLLRERAAPAPSSPTTADVASGAIAVLPAEVLAGADDDWLRLGMMELIAVRLRGAGLAVVSSDSVVRAIAPHSAGANAIASLRKAIDARALVMPALRRNGGDWLVRIEIDDGGAARAVQAQAASPVAATDACVAKLLGLFGRSTPGEAGAQAADLTELLQRTDAARLAENLDLARSIIAQAPPALRDLPEVRERAIRIDLRAGAFEKARADLEALLARVPAETEPVMHARLLENLCVARMRLGQLQAALPACDASIALLESRNEPLALGRAYSDRGVLHARSGRRDAALADFAQSRIALTLAGDPLLLAQLDGNESTVEMVHGRPAEAAPILERAARTFRRFGMINEFATALVNEIGAHLMLLQPAQALQASDVGWAERGRITDPQVGAAFGQARAETLAANGRSSEARALLDAILHAAPAPDPVQAALARTLEAEMDLDAGEPGTARVLARQAVAALEAPERAADRARAWLAEVHALVALDRLDEAAASAAAFAAWAAPFADRRVQWQAALARAAQAAAAKRTDVADSACADAMRSAGERGTADAVVQTTVECAGHRLAAHRLDEAAALVGALGRYADRDYAAALIETRLYRALGQADAERAALERVRRLAGERPVPDLAAAAPVRL